MSEVKAREKLLKHEYEWREETEKTRIALSTRCSQLMQLRQAAQRHCNSALVDLQSKSTGWAIIYQRLQLH